LFVAVAADDDDDVVIKQNYAYEQIPLHGTN
jgi:hypothetical protein